MERKVNKKDFLSLARKKWRSNHVDDEMLQKTRDVLIESRLVETMTFKKMVIAIGAGVIKANEPKKLKEFGWGLELTQGWALNLLQDMDWVQRKETTGKVEPYTKFLKEEKFSFECAISKFVSENDIPL